MITRDLLERPERIPVSALPAPDLCGLPLWPWSLGHTAPALSRSSLRYPLLGLDGILRTVALAHTQLCRSSRGTPHQQGLGSLEPRNKKARHQCYLVSGLPFFPRATRLARCR
jgi:hypothetical protein